MSSNNNFDSNDSNRPNGFDFASLSPPSLRPAPPSSLGLVYNQQNESNEPVEDVDIMGMLNKLDEIEPRDAQESERVLEMRARLHRIMVNKAYARFETAIAYNGTLEPNDYAPTFSMREFLGKSQSGRQALSDLDALAIGIPSMKLSNWYTRTNDDSCMPPSPELVKSFIECLDKDQEPDVVDDLFTVMPPEWFLKEHSGEKSSEMLLELVQKLHQSAVRHRNKVRQVREATASLEAQKTLYKQVVNSTSAMHIEAEKLHEALIEREAQLDRDQSERLLEQLGA